jgi:hypothetical protein
MLAALSGRVPDRLPVTTHHVMPYFLDRYSDHFFDAQPELIRAFAEQAHRCLYA